MIRLSWDLPAEAEHVRLCRHLVRVVMEHMVAEEQEIEEIELAVGELCANVVRHAQLSPGHSYLVDLEVREDSLVFSVSDMGVGFVPEVTADPDPHRFRRAGPVAGQPAHRSPGVEVVGWQRDRRTRRAPSEAARSPLA